MNEEDFIKTPVRSPSDSQYCLLRSHKGQYIVVVVHDGLIDDVKKCELVCRRWSLALGARECLLVSAERKRYHGNKETYQHFLELERQGQVDWRTRREPN